jgi:putative endonuclease
MARGAAARLSGRRSEAWAAAWLMAKGYRILGFRLKTPQAEIDLLAKKGAVLAVVEVKSRTEIEAALEAVTFDQRERLRRAGVTLAARRPRPGRLRGCASTWWLSRPGRFPGIFPIAWKGGVRARWTPMQHRATLTLATAGRPGRRTSRCSTPPSPAPSTRTRRATPPPRARWRRSASSAWPNG